MPSLRYRPLSDASELSDFYCNVDVMDSFIHDGLEDELREKNCLSCIGTVQCPLDLPGEFCTPFASELIGRLIPGYCDA